jgi:hypothetical protein
VGIPKASQGDSDLRMEMMVSPYVEAEAKEFTLGGRTLEAMPPQQQIPQRRGRPRKNKEACENQIPTEACARLVAEALLMCII